MDEELEIATIKEVIKSFTLDELKQVKKSMKYIVGTLDKEESLINQYELRISIIDEILKWS